MSSRRWRPIPKASLITGGKPYARMWDGAKAAVICSAGMPLQAPRRQRWHRPCTSGVLERLEDFRAYEESIDSRPILEHLAAYPPLERPLSQEVEAMLPALMGTLAMLTGQVSMLTGQVRRIIGPEVQNPGPDLWERVLRLMELML